MDKGPAEFKNNYYVKGLRAGCTNDELESFIEKVCPAFQPVLLSRQSCFLVRNLGTFQEQNVALYVLLLRQRVLRTLRVWRELDSCSSSSINVLCSTDWVAYPNHRKL